jgi:hypothetical protein
MATKESQKAYRLRKAYKQTPEDREAILAAQGYKCAICDRPFDGNDPYMPFQDFENQEIRGLLCFVCLRAMKMLSLIEKKGTPLEQALAYRRKWKR